MATWTYFACDGWELQTKTIYLKWLIPNNKNTKWRSFLPIESQVRRADIVLKDGVLYLIRSYLSCHAVYVNLVIAMQVKQK